MKNFHIGITGTRSGGSIKQYVKLQQLVGVFYSIYQEKFNLVFHHGDCVGVDVDAADVANELGYRVISHPPIKSEMRAFHKSDEIRETKSYFVRNRDIVHESQFLIVVPKESERSTKGGTWYTHDYASKNMKDGVIIWPNGEIEKI